MKKTVSVGRTYNLGNYESLRLDVGFESDDPVVTTMDLYEDCIHYLSHMEQEQRVQLK